MNDNKKLSVAVFRKRRNSSFQKTPESDDFSSAGRASPSKVGRHAGKGPVVEGETHTNKGFVFEPSGSDKVCETSTSRLVAVLIY